eukprot:CAMPEP_0184297176 /NCGR_PEP_ID=MMETSP1049-20130417/8101_1 /TAXON_ID=77928 /ORGANISM="Proteomonas sulcata, Strain CCMP704" /LENGTH=82 /DNA_ID=CAMNT_0026606779 /DNA_START=191 /DNA_END=439 /DNA_ORIENTATION=+
MKSRLLEGVGAVGVDEAVISGLHVDTVEVSRVANRVDGGSPERRVPVDVLDGVGKNDLGSDLHQELRSARQISSKLDATSVG